MRDFLVVMVNAAAAGISIALIPTTGPVGPLATVTAPQPLGVRLPVWHGV